MHIDINDPTELSVFATNKCNFRCWFCRRTSGDLDMKKDIDIPTVEAALNKYPSIKSVCIAGFGEPLLYRGLDSLLFLLEERNINVGLITNGSLVLKRKRLFQNHPVRSISISLNSVDQKGHAEINGVDGKFDEIVDGISWLKANTQSKIYVSFVIHHGNYQIIPEALELGLKCDGIDFHNLLPHKKEQYDKIITTADTEILAEINTYKSHPKAGKVKSWPKPVGTPKEVGNCRLCFQHMLLAPGGYVSCCARVMPPVPGSPIIYQEGVWNSDFCNDIRNDIKTRDECLYCFGNY